MGAPGHGWRTRPGDHGYVLALVVGSQYWGGAERVVENLVAALPQDVDVVVVGPEPAVVRRVAGSRARFLIVPMRTRRMLAALAAVSPDVVHVNLPSATDCRRAVAAALLLGLPTVLVDHLPVPGLTWKGRLVQRGVTGLAAARVSVGRRASRLVETHCGLPTGTVATIDNGVPPPARHGPVSSRQPFRTAGVLGALDRRKGVDVLLDALPGVPGLGLLVAGEGPARGELEAQAVALGLGDRVQFLGWTDDVGGFLDRVDVLVVPSRQEALPLVVLEAMHAGLPVVATSVGSVEEAVTDGVTGIVVPSDDPEALRRALVTLVADPDRVRAYGSAAAEVAATRFTVAAMAGQYDRLYRRLPRRRAPLRLTLARRLALGR